jgi:hypothetical protein
MTTVDLRLEYQKETGNGLPNVLGGGMTEFSEDELVAYAKWLEDYILREFNVFEHAKNVQLGDMSDDELRR